MNHLCSRSKVLLVSRTKLYTGEMKIKRRDGGTSNGFSHIVIKRSAMGAEGKGQNSGLPSH